MTKFGADPTELDCRHVQVGTDEGPDGTSQPIFRVEPVDTTAYRELVHVVTNQPVTIDADS